MDERSFDEIARAIGGATTRRGALAGLAALGVGLPFGAAAKNGQDDRPDRPSDAKKKKKCKPAKCPTGCCSGKKCLPGDTAAACGAGGATCVACGAGETCIGGACVAECGPGNCPGCCDPVTNTCEAGTSAGACGSGGVACAACAAGQVCPSGTCEAACGPANCAGCCDAATNVCEPGTAAGACGTGGAACAACAGDAFCCVAGACAAGTWTNPRIFGSDGAAIDEFSSPHGVAVSGDGRTVVVSDTGNKRGSMWRLLDTDPPAWSPSATFGSAGPLPDEFQQPEGVALASDGLTAWIADYGNHRIAVWMRPSASSTAWAIAATFGTLGPGLDQFQQPYGVAVSDDLLTVWASDLVSRRVSVWTRPSVDSNAWTWQASFGGTGSGANQFNAPMGLAASTDGLTVLVADHGNDRVSVWTRPSAGSIVWSNQTTFGATGTGIGKFQVPRDVALSPDGRTAWVADTGNQRVSVWTRPDAASVAWTNLETFGSGPGPALGQFSVPIAVAVGSDGRTAWIADTDNDRISVWEKTCP